MLKSEFAAKLEMTIGYLIIAVVMRRRKLGLSEDAYR